MIYFSIIGMNDCHIDIFSPHMTGGATLTTFMHYKDEIEQVYLFKTKTGDLEKDQMVKKGAEINEKVMKSEKRDIQFTTIEFDFFPSPIDYKIVYNEMRAKIIELMAVNKILKKEKIINISSGTPTMTACWLLLQQSNIIPAKLVQSLPPEYRKKTNTSVQEVDFSIENFPKIENRDVLQQQLKNQLVKVEKYQQQLSVNELHDRFPGFIGRSKALTDIKEQIISYAKSHEHVLILGEPGTGKELVAQMLHKLSERKKHPYKIVNLGDKSDSLIESELFGHTVGAYTGAKKARKGLFISASKGTIFIDEIGDMPKTIQTRFLRVMEYGDVKSEGMDEPYTVDVRLVAATNQDISDKVKKGKFRTDFLTRFGPVIELPPLRHRKEDILDLIYHFGGNELNLSEDCLKKFQNENWSLGNVRELKGKIEAAKTVKQDRPIKWEDLPRTAASILEKPDALPDLPLPLPLSSKKEYDYNDAIIKKARKIANNKSEEVDRLLGQAGKRVDANRKLREKKK